MSCGKCDDRRGGTAQAMETTNELRKPNWKRYTGPRPALISMHKPGPYVYERTALYRGGPSYVHRTQMPCTTYGMCTNSVRCQRIVHLASLCRRKGRPSAHLRIAEFFPLAFEQINR